MWEGGKEVYNKGDLLRKREVKIDPVCVGV